MALVDFFCQILQASPAPLGSDSANQENDDSGALLEAEERRRAMKMRTPLLKRELSSMGTARA